MRQSSRVDPSNPSLPATGLHPVLSLALANLDIQLEDELVRYRRQRSGTKRAVPQAGRKQPSPQLDLIAVAATSAKNSKTSQSPAAIEERSTGVVEPRSASDTYQPIPAFTAQPQPFDAAIALRPAENSPTYDANPDPTALPAEVGNVHALAQANAPNLDDYLESSEELLRSLADEQAEVQAERSFMQSLLTPLGLGSMLLLLLSSAMFGYVIMNPSSVSWLSAQRNTSTNSPPGPNAGTVGMPAPQPDLAKRELPELNLNNLGTVNVSPGSWSSQKPTSSQKLTQPTATPDSKPTIASAQPSSAQPTSNQTTSAPTQPTIPAASSSSRNAPPVQPASPQQAALPNRVAPARAPLAPSRPDSPIGVTSASSNRDSASYQYKVGIPFENDQTLEQARKVVPDAFVRTLPDGRTIVQVGAARSESEVNTSMQGLRDRGLTSAEVYKR